jgi:hypothetical protein
MGHDGVAQRGVGQRSQHGDLNARHDLASANTEGSETEDPIAIR